MTSNDTPIAIVGISYRAPGVGRKGLWEYLAEAKSAWSKVPEKRFRQDAYYHPDHNKAGTFSSQGGHFLPDEYNIYAFDAPFFNLRPDEAAAADPQHRTLLECAFEAAESAGISLVDIAGTNTGVFSAIGTTEYGQQAAEDIYATTTWTALGNAPCMFANRLSYFFNLNGPSIALDAACASSSYAVHLACQSLRTGECNAAFVGASALLLGNNLWTCLDKLGALSPEGKCFSYDKKGSGFGRGEGAAVLLIKRLDDAISAGDPIHAVIRNTAAGHSGRSDGITMPSRKVQEQMLLRVHESIGLNPSDTPVVEGHGTGTQAGDPIEAGAFATVLAKDRTPSDPLYIGSLKSNFGHLEGASGILGLVKAVLMLQHDSVLPNANFEEFNPNIEGKERLRVPETALPWPANVLKRALVTNFGFGGSNAAVLLEAASSFSHSSSGLSNGANVNGTKSNGLTNGSSTTHGNGVVNGHGNTNGNGYVNGNGIINGNGIVKGNGHVNGHASHGSSRRLFVLSARTESSLTSYLSSFKEYLETIKHYDGFEKDLSYTLGQRRTPHPYRVAVIADSVSSLKDNLTGRKVSKVKDRTITFAFTGQGAQSAQMAAGLRRYPIFAATIDQAEELLQEMGASWSLKEELDKPAPESRVNDAEISQPACTAVQLALVTLLKSWGITPSTVAGHSSGEIAAAYSAGLVTFEAAVAIAYFRGQAAAQLSRENGPKGAMLALGAGPDVASKLIEQNTEGYATIAANNSPQSVTISGDEGAIDNIKKIADEQDLFNRKLKVEVAYHSRHMERVAASYLAAIKPFVNAEAPSIDPDDVLPIFVSSVTGQVENETTVDVSYWVKNLLQPVRFSDAVAGTFSTADEGQQQNTKAPNVIVEIGPHSALQNPIKQTIELIRERGDRRVGQFNYLASLVRGTSGDEALLSLAANLFTMGNSVEFAEVNQTGKDARVLVDLPAYEWDKSATYIYKSRISKEKLHPGQSFAPLLGNKSIYGVGSEPTFRHVFTLDDVPWIRDHNVAGTSIFPMTGYLSMAVEAVRRVNPTIPSSVLVQEFHVKRSLDIEEDEKVDITTKLRPTSTGTESFSSTSWTFEISSWTEEDGWTSHCHGQIEADSSDLSTDSPTFAASEPLLSTDKLEEQDVELAYGNLTRGGTAYGPAFRAIRRLWEAPTWTVMETELRDIDLSPPALFGSLIAVDPPTLDSHLQGIVPFQRKAAYMPNYVSRLRISNKIEVVGKQRFVTVCRILGYDAKAGRLQASIAVFAKTNGSLVPFAEWESVTYRSINESDHAESAASLPAGYQWTQIPSMDYIGNEDLAKLVSDAPGDIETRLGNRRKVNTAGLYYMDQAIKETSGDDLSKLPSHLARYYSWSKSFVAQKNETFDERPSSLLEEVSNADAQGEMLCAIGEKLPEILRGEIEPLEIMLKDNLLMRNYESEPAGEQCSRVLGKFVRQLSDIKPNLRVLEIGGGTASSTLPIFKELSDDSEELPASLSYTFTDVSAGFFENARVKLAKWAPYITFKKLDVGLDPVQQGFNVDSYDVIVASNVLHATPNMATTLDNVRNLLKPNGKLLLLEGVNRQALSLPFTLLPGWWLSEDDYRDYGEGALLTLEAWQRVLSDRGFSGVDATVADYPDTPDHMLSVIVTTRTGLQQESFSNEPITICGVIEDDEDEEFAQQVCEQVTERLGCQASVKPLFEIDPADDAFCIVIDSRKRSVLTDVSEETFETLKKTLLETKGLLWVIPENSPPAAKGIEGLMRTMRHETESRNLLVFGNAPGTADGAFAVSQLAERLRDIELANASGIKDQDFVWHEEKLHVLRFKQLAGARDAFASDAGIPIRKVQKIKDSDESLEMTVDAAGSPDSIYFKRTDVKSQPLGEDEVLIQAQASGMNFRDLLLVLGSIPWTRPGFEGAGVVVQTGSKVKNVKAGDQVFYGTLAGGSYGTYVRMASWRACKLPEHLTSAEAASIPVAYCTAIFSILKVGRLRQRESVLIHAASGAVGQACIVLAQHIGARIFATAGTPAKRQFLQDTYGIPKEQIFSSRTPEFRDGILRATEGKGVDVVVNSLSGSLLQETWALIADFGRFVEIGKKDLLQNTNLGMRPFDRNVSFSGVDLRSLFDRRPDEERECLADLIDLVNRQVVKPIQPVTQISISQLAIGLRKLQGGQNIGKIIVTIDPDDTLLAEQPATLEVASGQLLQPDATYLITGGTGGIGLSLASWMVDNGARNVVLLGRSGASRPAVQKLLERYEGTNVQMRAVACDVGSRTELENALQAIKDLPPVRGVVHGALYLHDTLIANASYDDWQKINAPRVQGAWNFHELLPKLDFFIALSSFVGDIGNVGQGIYSGTSTFFEEFARFRNALGQRTVSIGLPVVLDVGYAAENNLTEVLKVSLGVTMTEADVHTVVKGAILGPSSRLNHDGQAISFRFSSGEDPDSLGWRYSHPLALAERVNAKQRSDAANAAQGDGARGKGQRAVNDENLLEVLMDKVSSITMIDRDEVEPDAPLVNYSLDSLVSVELRNWIRRETGVDLPLPKIVGSANLRALASHILSQREARK